jgi:AcrR family transcriptional regulator
VNLSTKDAIVAAAMDLFGRQGYHATTVAQIEAAAGLSAGSGGLYRHFKSKRAVLEEGLDRQAAAGRPLADHLAGQGAAQGVGDGDRPAGRRERFRAIALAGLARLEEERDVNRLLVRDLASFPDLLDQVRERELRRMHRAVSGFIGRELPAEPDPEALAAVVMAAISHYWIMVDVFDGRHPHEVDRERFVATLVRLLIPDAIADG